MTLSLNQAQSIVQKLSNEQLMQAYTSGTVPQFVVFTEMQRRQKMAGANAKPPTGTVAERMVGRDEPQGIEAALPHEEPQMAAKGGITKASTLTIGGEYIPKSALPILRMRYEQMRDEEEPMTMDGGGEVKAPPPSSGSPISHEDIAEILMPSLIGVESGGRQSAVSPKGATGAAQLMESTARSVAKANNIPWDYNRYVNDKDYNVLLGKKYLAENLKRFGDREQALAAYNAGPTATQRAIEKANASGRPWLSFLPKETRDYVPKVLGGAQAQLPARQDPEGPDTQPVYGYDSAFSPKDVKSYYSGFEYPRKEESNIDKGLAALKAAQTVKGLRFKDGGPVYLGGGGKSKAEDYARDKSFRDFASIQELTTGKPTQFHGTDIGLPMDYPGGQNYGSFVTEEDDKAEAELNRSLNPSYQEALRRAGNPREQEVSPFLRAKKEREDRQGPSDFPEDRTQIRNTAPSGIANIPVDQGDTADSSGYGMTNWSQGAAGKPEGEAPRGGTAPFTGSEPPPGSPEYKQAEALLKAQQEKDAALKGPAAGGRPAIPGMTQAPDPSFDVVMKQVQDAIGSKIPDELRENMKKHQEAIASMKNDKLVDALFAAAKTLAGQRVGQQNFGDAVANAGLAAQEAQKRIYKAEDDMRKYRGDLLRAQDENNYRAASIAMNRIVQLDHDKKSLSIATMQAQRAHDTAMKVSDRDDQRAKLAQDKLAQTEMLARRKEIMTEISKIDDHIRAISPRPDKIEMDPEGSKKRIEEAKANRERLRRELQSIGGSSPSVVTEDPKPILKYNPQTGKVE